MPSAKPSVLVVEGDLLSALTLKQVISLAFDGDATVDCCHSLADARHAVIARGHRVVVLDPELPDSHAEHTVATLHNHAPDAAIIVIADGDFDDLSGRCARAGADRFLLKREATPLRIHELITTAYSETTAFKASGSPPRPWT